jgi:hypothetical protein
VFKRISYWLERMSVPKKVSYLFLGVMVLWIIYSVGGSTLMLLGHFIGIYELPTTEAWFLGIFISVPLAIIVEAIFEFAMKVDAIRKVINVTIYAYFLACVIFTILVIVAFTTRNLTLINVLRKLLVAT